MAKVLKRGDVEIGAFKIPGLKKPRLGIWTGKQLVVYGSFMSEESADDFMETLAEFVGAEKEENDG